MMLNNAQTKKKIGKSQIPELTEDDMPVVNYKRFGIYFYLSI